MVRACLRVHAFETVSPLRMGTHRRRWLTLRWWDGERIDVCDEVMMYTDGADNFGFFLLDRVSNILCVCLRLQYVFHTNCMQIYR